MVKHSQAIRLSASYNSAEVNYGVELPCDNNPEAIRIAMRKAEKLVEEYLGKKIPERVATLQKYAAK